MRKNYSGGQLRWDSKNVSFCLSAATEIMKTNKNKNQTTLLKIKFSWIAILVLGLNPNQGGIFGRSKGWGVGVMVIQVMEVFDYALKISLSFRYTFMEEEGFPLML